MSPKTIHNPHRQNTYLLGPDHPLDLRCNHYTVRHKLSSEELEILRDLEKHKGSTVLPSEVIDELVEKLSRHTDHWTCQRIRYRWYNKCKRTKKIYVLFHLLCTCTKTVLGRQLTGFDL